MAIAGKSWVHRHPASVFLCAAFTTTMIFAMLAHSPAIALAGSPRLFCTYAAKFGPTIASLFVVTLLAGRGGLRALLIPAWRRVGVGWYAFAVGGPVVLTLIAVGLAAAMGGKSITPATVSAPSLLLAFLRPVFLGGGLGEELGWRGFMLPLLQHRRGPIRGSVLVGIAWGLWHAPAFIFPATGKSGGIAGLLLFVVLCVVMSVVFTWFYNATNGNFILVILLHGCINGSLDAADLLFPDITPDLIWAVLLFIIAMALLVSTRLGKATDAPIVEVMGTSAYDQSFLLKTK